MTKIIKSFKQIPGPKRLPFIGNLWRYFPIIGQYDVESMYENGCYNLKRYGEIVREEITKNHKILHLFNPIDMESMFIQQRNNPYRRSHRALIKYRHERPHKYQSGGIFPENGDEWKRLRNLFKHYFLQSKSINIYDEQLNLIVEDLIHSIRLKRHKNNNSIDNLQEFLYRWSLESICSIMLDARIGCFVPNNADGNTMIEGGQKTLYAVMRTELYDGWQTRHTKDYQCLVDGQDLMDSVVTKFLDKKILEYNLKHLNEYRNEKRSTILEQMILDPDITKKDLFGIVMDFIFAGIDTTSTTAGFALYFIAKHEQIQQKLYEEVRKTLGNDHYFKAEHFDRTPLLKACIKETLRLRPVSIGVGRLATDDMIINEYLIPKNTLIITQNQIACRLEKYYTNADKFDPYRWLNNDEKNKNRNLYRYLYIPFGHGTRMCLGRRIAELELYILLANLINKFLLKYDPQQYRKELGFRTRLINLPDQPIRLKFIDRNSN